MKRVEDVSPHFRSLVVAALRNRRSTVVLDLATAGAVLVALDSRAQRLALIRKALGEPACHACPHWRKRPNCTSSSTSEARRGHRGGKENE